MTKSKIGLLSGPLELSILLAVVAIERPVEAQVWEFKQWGILDQAAGWSIEAGDFSGSGRDDLLAYHPADGTVWVGRNTGSAFDFGASPWATLSPSSGWRVISAQVDRDGSGLADLVAYHTGDGSIWVGLNTGESRFELSASNWANLIPFADWTIDAGDYDGDGLDDLLGYHPSDGSIYVGLNNGISTFVFQLWNTVTPAADWQISAARIDFDGLVDLVAHHPSDGTVTVGINRGGRFAFEIDWARTSPPAGYIVRSLDFDCNGRDDIVAYYPDDGSFSVARNTGSQFQSFVEFATAMPADGWLLAPGRFYEDESVAIYHPSDGSVWAGERVEDLEERGAGYAWPLSAAPGERIEFMVSGSFDREVTFLRHVSVGQGVTSVATGSAVYEPAFYPVPPEAWRDGCGWPVAFDLVVPAGWKSGMYSARLTTCGGHESHITFVVKPGEDDESRVAVLANTNTWLAYNDFGGRSKYCDIREIAICTAPGPARFSYLRPNPVASPIGESGPNHHLARAELWILGFLESSGYEPHLFTDIDLHDESFLDRYDVFVIGTHPEYWTIEMYDRLKAFLERGGSLLYLGGNGVFEAGEYSEDRSAMTFLGGLEGAFQNDVRSRSFFRNLTPPRPERSLLGVASEQCGAPGRPFLVLEPGHPLFAGTGVELHSRIGEFGFNTNGGHPDHLSGGASGHEVDTANGPESIKPTICSLAPPPNPRPLAALPQGLTVIAQAERDVEIGADMTYYRHPAGGFVLSAGSITFGGSLVVDPILQRVVRNAIDSALEPTGPEPFRRGDSNGDGRVDLSDAVVTLGVLFLGTEDPGCKDARDANDDGAVDISDAVLTLGVLFLGNGTIPEPGIGSCGADPTVDEQDCEVRQSCP